MAAEFSWALAKRLGSQALWSVSSRGVAALLQLAVFLLLARQLSPGVFAGVSAIYSGLVVATFLSDFGITRRMQYLRSVRHHDPRLRGLYRKRLKFTYLSALTWLVGVVAGWALWGGHWPAFAPLTIWLMAEQCTQTWNAISVADGQAQDLMLSLILRRLPVALALVGALQFNWDTIWTWSVGLTLGAVSAFLEGYFRQERDFRSLWPAWKDPTDRVRSQFDYWWLQLGGQLRELDLLLMALVNPVAAGLYALPSRFARPMNLVTAATSAVLFPPLARNRTISRRRILEIVATANSPTIVVAMAMFFGSAGLISLAGPGYEASAAVLRVSCLGIVMTGFTIVLGTILQARSRGAARQAGLMVLCFAVIQVMCGALALGAWGALGAAWAVSAVQTVCAAFLLKVALVSDSNSIGEAVRHPIQQ